VSAKLSLIGGAALSALLLGWPPASGQQPEPRGSPAAIDDDAVCSCAGIPSYAHCRTGCEPGRLIFLPCMAVGARNMASCRQREVASCVRACVSRHCS
jgi:hypothetical protein